jgi:hypothetical protein
MTPEHKAAMQAGRKAATTQSKPGSPVLCSNGLYLIARLTKKQAIQAHCTHCMGFETNPVDCTSWACALYPFRGRTLRTREGDLTKQEARMYRK